jgi:hypothetical protein
LLWDTLDSRQVTGTPFFINFIRPSAERKLYEM